MKTLYPQVHIVNGGEGTRGRDEPGRITNPKQNVGCQKLGGKFTLILSYTWRFQPLNCIWNYTEV